MDAINPDHYKRLPAEAIEIIEAMIAGAPDNKAAYLHGQAAKYDLRLWRKGKSLEDYLADLGKHIWYALRLESHLLELIEKQKSDETQKASDLQSHKEHPFEEPDQPKWTPKTGDWVRIKNIDPREAWMPEMDKYDGKIVQVEEFDGRAIVHDEWCFVFDWLEPAEQPKAHLNSDTIPEGYRKLGDSLIEPRQRGDLRWSIAEKRYIEIGFEQIGYANRENWAACRKITGEVTGEATVEVKPPDGWRWLEVGETLRRGDTTNTIEPIPEHWVGTQCVVKHVALRRNRFKVGEKVVAKDSHEIWEVDSLVNGVYQLRKDQIFFGSYPEHLAPYIEETK